MKTSWSHWPAWIAGLLVLTFVTSELHAQSDLSPTVIADWPGFVRSGTRAVALKQKGSSIYACVAADYALQIFDVTQPDKPKFVSGCALSDRPLEVGAEEIVVSGDYAYLTAYKWQGPPDYGSLQVFDLRDVEHPMRAGSFDVGGKAVSLAMSGQYAFVGVNGNPDVGEVTGVRVIDVSDPSAPLSVADYFITVSLPTGKAYITDVALIADHLYVATSVGGGGGGSLEVIDVSNPRQPTWAAALDMPDAGGIIPRSGYTYVLRSDRVITLDVRDPAKPQVVGNWGAGLVNPIVLFDHYAYMGSSIFDVSNPVQPVAVGTSDDSFAGRSYGVTGSYLYSATRSGPLIWGVGSMGAFDMSNPLQLRRVGSFATYGNAQEVAIQGARAYVADGCALKVFEIGNPAKPVFLGGDNTITNDNSSAFCVKVTGQYAYVAEWSRWSGAFRFHIMDVIDATAPLRVGGYSISMKPIADHGFAPQVCFVGVNAYVIEPSTQWRTTPSYLHILDLSNPTQPVLAGKCEIPGTVTAATVVGQRAYVAVGGSQSDLLLVYDVSDPALPKQLGMTNAADCGRDLCVVGRHAYVAIPNFIEVFEVSNPTQPTLVSRCRVGPDAEPVGIVNIASDGSYLYLSEEVRHWEGNTELKSGRLGVIDVRDPANPIRVGGWTIADDHLMGRLTLAGNYAYVADGQWGFTVVRLRDLLTLNAPLLSPNGLALSWPGGPGIKLQKTTSLIIPNWEDVPGSDGVSQIELPRTDLAAFFRLVKP